MSIFVFDLLSWEWQNFIHGCICILKWHIDTVSRKQISLYIDIMRFNDSPSSKCHKKKKTEKKKQKNRTDNTRNSIPLNTLLGVLFVIVNHKVSCHTTFLWEATPTNGTLERLFTCMWPYMVFKVEFPRKGLSTHIACKLFLVSSGHWAWFFN